MMQRAERTFSCQIPLGIRFTGSSSSASPTDRHDCNKARTVIALRRNPLVVDWEDAIVPALGAVALHQIKKNGPSAIKRVLWSEILQQWYATTIDLVYKGDIDLHRQHFLTADRDALVNLGFDNNIQMSETSRDYDLLVLPPMRGVTDDASKTLSDAVAQKLLDKEDSFGLFHHSGIGRWVRVMNFFDVSKPHDSIEAHNSETQNFYEIWNAQMAPVDTRYINNPQLGLKHIQLILSWVAGFFNGEQAKTFNADAGIVGRVALSRIEQRIADLLHSHGLISQPQWKRVLPAQIGSNSASGLAFWLGDQKVPVQSQQLTRKDQVTGTTLLNECFLSRETDAGLTSSDHGGSLADNILNKEQIWHDEMFWVPPEASCVLSREQESDPDAFPKNFQSKFSDDEMEWILTEFTSGAVMQGVPVPVDSTLSFNGSSNIAKLYFGMKDIWYDFDDKSLIGAISSEQNRSSGVTSLLKLYTLQRQTTLRNNRDTVAYLNAAVMKETVAKTYRESIGEDPASRRGQTLESNGLACRNHLKRVWQLDFGGIPFTCEKLFDLVYWLDYLAREFVFKPQFMNNDPEGVLPSELEINSGPVVRTTALKYLVDGIEDPLFKRIYGFDFPGIAPPNHDDSGQWYEQFGRTMPPDAMSTGLELSDTVGQLVQRNGSSTLEAWGEQTVVQGSAFGWQKPPQLQRIPDFSKFELSVPIWLPSLQRSADFKYQARVRDETRDLFVQRYELVNAADIQSFTSDLVFCRRAEVQACRGGEVELAPPACLRSMRYAPSFLSPKRSYADFLYGQPFLFGCDAQTQATGYEWRDTESVSRNDASAHGSWVEYEPILGQATQSVFREGRYIRQRPSRWYAKARDAILQLHAVTRSRSVPAETAKEWSAELGARNTMIDSSIPGAAFGLGTILAVVGAMSYLMYKRQKRQDMVKVRPPKVRSFAEVQAARQSKLREAEQHLRKQHANRQTKSKRSQRRSEMLNKDAAEPDIAEAAKERVFTLEEIEKEMHRLEERRKELLEAAKQGRTWAADPELGVSSPSAAARKPMVDSKAAPSHQGPDSGASDTKSWFSSLLSGNKVAPEPKDHPENPLAATKSPSSSVQQANKSSSGVVGDDKKQPPKSEAAQKDQEDKSASETQASAPQTALEAPEAKGNVADENEAK